jgi:hypothetical protein
MNIRGLWQTAKVFGVEIPKETLGFVVEYLGIAMRGLLPVGQSGHA